jgi:hypothetical protein
VIWTPHVSLRVRLTTGWSGEDPRASMLTGRPVRELAL